MNIKVAGSEECEEKEFKVPKTRNLLPSKTYRESIKRWGEPTELRRRRVIIVPSIKCSSREVSATTVSQGKKANNMG